MEGKKKIFSIAFEGMHRSGKGTQIELLKNKLSEIGLPCIAVQGEGYRRGIGSSPEDPQSDVWQKLSDQLKRGEGFDIWDEASYRLARELIIWRERVLNKEVSETLSPLGVLILDRSLISKSLLKTLQLKPSPTKIFSPDELYPDAIQHRKKITVDMVLPDIIFNLIAPKDVLLSRLDPQDPKYEFRKNNIIKDFDLYTSAKMHLSEEIKKRIVDIDSSAPAEEVYKAVMEQIKQRIPELDNFIDKINAKNK